MLRPLQLLLLLALTVALLSAGPTTAPNAPQLGAAKSAGADDMLTSHLRKLFTALADPDAAVRQEAYDTLMQIDVAHLPILQQIVEQTASLQPSQRAVLHEIVCQVYMAGQSYPGNPASGFMGVRLWTAEFEGPSIGVEIVERIPGFGGYAAFRNGDIITALLSDPPIPLLEPADLMELVNHSFHAGQFLVFDVLRQGKHIHVLVRLMPYPEQNLDLVRELSATRSEAAQQYWDAHFAPLLDRNPI
jgi:hypothetical protein